MVFADRTAAKPGAVCPDTAYRRGIALLDLIGHLGFDTLSRMNREYARAGVPSRRSFLDTSVQVPGG